MEKFRISGGFDEPPEGRKKSPTLHHSPTPLKKRELLYPPYIPVGKIEAHHGIPPKYRDDYQKTIRIILQAITTHLQTSAPTDPPLGPGEILEYTQDLTRALVEKSGVTMEPAIQNLITRIACERVVVALKAN